MITVFPLSEELSFEALPEEDRGASYLYSYPYDKISYVFVTKKGGKEIKSFEDAAGLSFEGGTGISVSNAVEAWNEKNPDKAINITYSDADTSVFYSM